MHLFSNVLITGGAGFVGSQLVKRLEPISDHIYVIDNLSAGSRDAVMTSEKVSFYESNYFDEALLEEVLPRVEYIFHLACRSLTLSMQDIKEDYLVNLHGALTLLEKTKAVSKQLRRIVYTSTASIYGNAESRPTAESIYDVTSPYAASKFAAEHYFQVYAHMYQLPVSIVRLSNVFGPGQLASNPYCGVVSKFFDAVQQGTPMNIHGDGFQTRDFTYVEDALDAILLTAIHSDSVGRVLNIGTGRETSVRQLASHIAAAAGFSDYPVEYVPKRPIDHVAHRSVDITAIQQTLKWSPRNTLIQGLEKTYAWLTRRGGSEGIGCNENSCFDGS